MSDLDDLLASFEEAKNARGIVLPVDDSVQRMAESQGLSYREKVVKTYGYSKLARHFKFNSIAEEEKCLDIEKKRLAAIERHNTPVGNKVRVVCGAWAKEFEAGKSVKEYRERFSLFLPIDEHKLAFGYYGDRLGERLEDDYILTAGEGLEFCRPRTP